MKDTRVKRTMTVEVTLTETYTMEIECDAVNTIEKLQRTYAAVNGNVKLDNGEWLREYVKRAQMTLVAKGGKVKARRSEGVKA